LKIIVIDFEEYHFLRVNSTSAVKKIKMNPNKTLLLLLISNIIVMASCTSSPAEKKNHVVRLARLVIDSSQLSNYKTFLKEGIETAVRLEPGVLTLYAVAEKENPTHITILEIYADTAAYEAHLQTPHFIKYKTATKDMVKSLELVATDPIVPEMKIK
jgi:quinol monooxygenase YgiN